MDIVKPTAEELAAEQAATALPKEEEVRAAVITEFGFDEVTDAEKIEKVTKKQMESAEKLSKAIGQKISYRTKVHELSQTPPPPKDDKKSLAPEDIDARVDQKLAARDLAEMQYPDAIKQEIQRVAQIQGVDVKTASRDPYIVGKIEGWKKEEAAKEASLGNNQNRGGSGGTKKDFSVDTPPNPDMNTPEGRKEWAEYKDWLKTQPGFK